MKQFKLSLVFAGLVAASTTSLYAEPITVPVASQAQELQEMERPVRGASKQQVEQKFGKPIDWTAAIGEPPITRWEYKDFNVFFEYDHVIHSVLKHNSSR